MTDKVQKIREGVEKLKSQLLRGACSSQIAMETMCKEEAYNEVLALLDSLQEEPVSEVLLCAADSNSYKYIESVRGAAIHAFEDGAKWQNEQIMAKAIYAVVSQVPCANEIILRNPESVHWFYLPQEMNNLGVNKGDKVKLIIIKED